MKKYYKIPLTERVIKIDGTSLFGFLLENYPDLYNREKGRIVLQYGGETHGIMTHNLKKKIEEYNQKTDRLYICMGVPKYIVAMGDEIISEYATGKPLEVLGTGSVLSAREVSQQEAYQYLEKTKNYEEVVTKMLNKDSYKMLKKSWFQRISSHLKSKKDN